MFSYILGRFAVMIPTLFVISVVTFIIIQLPPGDYLTTYAAQLREQGDEVDEVLMARLERRYGLGQPQHVQYLKWISGILLRGDWGESMLFQKPVEDLIWDRLGLTFILSFTTLLFGWLVSIPLGVYSATHQYSVIDYVVTALNFIGKGLPEFMLALVIMWLVTSYSDMSVGGLFSPEYMDAPWTIDRILDLLAHVWIPIVILAVGSTANGIRITRANLLDELNKPYVETARAKGVKETRLIWKYPTRVALNPFFSTVGWSLADLISGTTIVAIVLSLQTTGPMLFTALINQDMFLAGSFIMMLSVLTVIGTLLSDLLLAWVDPRIRLEEIA
ncbi:MAG: ABC transporter permease [Caldilineaceae bacterium]|nr:ABC transporter permease [Caldilineaceae bacterium]MCY3989900.1 ABC transporter permease [Caldilineaceae bacterium]